jgi:amidophosphoribosyltransferase
MCGFVGIISDHGVVGDIYDALLSIQHRGQDAAGMLTFDEVEGRIHLEKGEGLVRDAFKPVQLARLIGNVGLGHTRYPTVGSGGIEDAQPMLTGSPFGIGLVHNGNVTNYHSLKRELYEQHSRYISTECDAEVLLAVLACELENRRVRRLDAEDVFTAVTRTLTRAQGAYSAVAMIAGQGLLAFRDALGIKPMVMGQRRSASGETEYGFASESGTLSLIGFRNVREVEPGEAVWIDSSRRLHRRRLIEKQHRPCLFEWVYFARPDALIDGISVYRSRQRAGEELAKVWQETGIEADVVIPVPDSACTAAQEMARVLGLTYSEALVKNRYIGRTFIMPGRSDRRRSVRKKLNPIASEFAGKRVLLVDDSIVRGNTSKELIRMAREAGADKVYLASYSPPLVHPCVYGIDMSTRDEFIARDHSVDEICRIIGADYLIYQTIDGLERAVREEGAEELRFCNACFTGEYPTGDITAEVFAAWEADRKPTQDQPLLPFTLAGGAREATAEGGGAGS